MKKLLAGLFVFGFLAVGVHQVHASIISDTLLKIQNLKNQVFQIKPSLKASVLDSSIGVTSTSTSTSIFVSTPIVTTPKVTSITQTSAVLGATVESLGNSTVTSYGYIYYGTSPRPSGLVKNTSTSVSTGAYSIPITGLTCGTRYYFYGAYTNVAGTGYSPDGTFTTSSCSIALIPSITVLSPNGGESYQAGQKITVTWKSENYSSENNLWVSTSNDDMITNSVLTKNTGSLIYTLGNSISGSNFKIKINPSSSAFESTLMDYSNSTFTINPTISPRCDYAAPLNGCTYVKGPDYNSVSDCGMILSCPTITSSIKVLKPLSSQYFQTGADISLSWSKSLNTPIGSVVDISYSSCDLNIGSCSSNFIQQANTSSSATWRATVNPGLWYINFDLRNKSGVGSYTLNRKIVPVNITPVPVCGYAAPKEGCVYVKGPDYNSVSNCGMILSCPTIISCTDSDNTPDIETTYIGSSNIDQYPSVYTKGTAKGQYIGSDTNLIFGQEPNLSSPKTSPYNYSVYTDYCQNSTQLNEAFCLSSGKMGASGFTCPNGCSNGACIKSTTTPSITVLSPNGGEVYQLGKEITVKWNSSNVPSTENVLIEMIRADQINNPTVGMGLQGWVTLAETTPNDGIQTFLLDKNLTPGTYELAVKRYFGAGDDISDNLFSIIKSPVVCPLIAQPSPDFCPNGKIESSLNENGCLSYKCINPIVIGKVSPCDPYGDVNDDGYLNEKDTTMMSQKIGGISSFTYDQTKRADVNKDGSVSVIDMTMIKNYITGAATSFPVCNNSILGGQKIVSITGNQSSYSNNSEIKLAIKTIDNTGNPASSANGYNIQSYIYPASDTGFDSRYLTPNPTYSYNGTYDSYSGIWTVKMNTPITTGLYNLRMALYCSNPTICGNPEEFIKVMPFTVTSLNNNPSITLITPNGGETYNVGEKVEVKWISSNIPNGLKKIQIGLSYKYRAPGENKDRTSYHSLLQETGDYLTENDGSYTVTLPSYEELKNISGYNNYNNDNGIPAAGNYYAIRVGYTPSTENSFDDSSDGLFTILPLPTISCPLNFPSPIMCPNSRVVADKYDSSGCVVSYKCSEIVPIVTPTLPVDINNKILEICSTPIFTKLMRVGLKHDDQVEALQIVLNEKGFLGDDQVDGSFGFKTKKALMAFQQANGLKADGVAGMKTRALLNTLWSNQCTADQANG